MLPLISLLLMSFYFVMASSPLEGLEGINRLYGEDNKHSQPTDRRRVETKVENSKRERVQINKTTPRVSQRTQMEAHKAEKSPLPAGYKRVEYSFKDINLLSDDMVLRGINPSYDFYVPVYKNLLRAYFSIIIFLPEYLRKDSSVSILVDDIPVRSLTLQDSGMPVYIEARPRKNRDFIKVSIKGDLRLSNNICEDVFSDKPYIIISSASKVGFDYKPMEDIHTFLMDYGRSFCIEDQDLLPIAYYLSKVRSIPPMFEWGTSEKCEKIIKLSNSDTRLEGNVLYITKSTLEALQEGYKPLVFGKALEVKDIVSKKEQEYSTLSFRELGVSTSTVKGMANISFYIPFSTSSFGGMPDNLYLRLNFLHTPAHQKDKMELRVYLNQALIKTLPLEGHGSRSIDIKIPTQELSYGHNTLVVNLVNFTSSDNCFGAVTQSALTVFDNSYFYWNSVSNQVKTIADFLRILNGRVGLLVEDKNMLPIALKFLSSLGEVNKSIQKIELFSDGMASNYNFVVKFAKQENSKGLFEVYDPVDGRVIFSAKYYIPFVFAYLSPKKVPELVFSYYGSPDFVAISELYDIRDYLNLFGDVAVISTDYFASFETNKKLRLRYEGEKGLSYYWNKYKGLFVLLMAVPLLYLFIYTYKRLTRRNI